MFSLALTHHSHALVAMAVALSLYGYWVDMQPFFSGLATSIVAVAYFSKVHPAGGVLSLLMISLLFFLVFSSNFRMVFAALILQSSLFAYTDFGWWGFWLVLFGYRLWMLGPELALWQASDMFVVQLCRCAIPSSAYPKPGSIPPLAVWTSGLEPDWTIPLQAALEYIPPVLAFVTFYLSLLLGILQPYLGVVYNFGRTIVQTILWWGSRYSYHWRPDWKIALDIRNEQKRRDARVPPAIVAQQYLHTKEMIKEQERRDYEAGRQAFLAHDKRRKEEEAHKEFLAEKERQMRKARETQRRRRLAEPDRPTVPVDVHGYPKWEDYHVEVRHYEEKKQYWDKRNAYIASLEGQALSDELDRIADGVKQREEQSYIRMFGSLDSPARLFHCPDVHMTGTTPPPQIVVVPCIHMTGTTPPRQSAVVPSVAPMPATSPAYPFGFPAVVPAPSVQPPVIALVQPMVQPLVEPLVEPVATPVQPSVQSPLFSPVEPSVQPPVSTPAQPSVQRPAQPAVPSPTMSELSSLPSSTPPSPPPPVSPPPVAEASVAPANKLTLAAAEGLRAVTEPSGQPEASRSQQSFQEHGEEEISEEQLLEEFLALSAPGGQQEKEILQEMKEYEEQGIAQEPIKTTVDKPARKIAIPVGARRKRRTEASTS
ncbi:hypothetical protein F5Y19DRAFT_488041 [Xylariaceae sp. FL1651]|nr:hypothetical protein F5Y19DRAFT_488041 [Xylariaceae sp. FL1651]